MCVVAAVVVYGIIGVVDEVCFLGGGLLGTVGVASNAVLFCAVAAAGCITAHKTSSVQTFAAL